MKTRSFILISVATAFLSILSGGAAMAAIDGNHPAICGDGCWVWIYKDDEFEGENDIVCGPLKRSDMKKLPNATRMDWSEQIESMRVGPNTTVRFWEDEAFEGYSRFYSPGTVKDEFDEGKDVEQVNSIELICSR